MSGIVSAVGSIFTGPEKPAVPDYAGAAEKTAQSNLEMAKYTTRANRPTQITPFGTQTWTNSGGFDQAGYDAAMQAYKDSYQPGTGRGGYWKTQEMAGIKVGIVNGFLRATKVDTRCLSLIAMTLCAKTIGRKRPR